MNIDGTTIIIYKQHCTRYWEKFDYRTAKWIMLINICVLLFSYKPRILCVRSATLFCCNFTPHNHCIVVNRSWQQKVPAWVLYSLKHIWCIIEGPEQYYLMRSHETCTGVNFLFSLVSIEQHFVIRDERRWIRRISALIRTRLMTPKPAPRVTLHSFDTYTNAISKQTTTSS